MWFVNGLLSLLGRLMIVAVFLAAGVGQLLPQFADNVAWMTAEGLPAARTLLVVGLIFLFVGSVLVLLGYQTRIGALLLLVFLSIATFTFHDFWTLTEEPTRTTQAMHFMKNLSLGGVLLFLIANGGGAWSLDSCASDRDDELI